MRAKLGSATKGNEVAALASALFAVVPFRALDGICQALYPRVDQDDAVFRRKPESFK